MGGGSGKNRKGRKNEQLAANGGGDVGPGNAQAGTLGRDMKLPKEKPKTKARKAASGKWHGGTNGPVMPV